MICRLVHGPAIHAVHWFTYVALIPEGSDLLRQVGGILGPAARLNTRPGSSPVAASRHVPLRPITVIRLVGIAMELIHAP